MLPKSRQPTHPGEILLEGFLKPMGVTQTVLAKHLGWSYARVNEIGKGRKGVTAETALALYDCFGNSAEFWLNLQNNLDLWQASQSREKYKKIKKAV